MSVDWLDRLRLDPGTRTVGELFQERQWALQEITRLRARVGQLEHRTARDPSPALTATVHPAEDPALTRHRLLRLAEVSRLVGLSRSSIYKLMSESRFPVPVRVGGRSVRWRLESVLGWQAQPSEV